MALFERNRRSGDEDYVTSTDAATRALSVTAVETDFVAGMYEKLASIYDYVFGPTLHAGRLQALQRMAISSGDRILEVGVGTGINLGTVHVVKDLNGHTALVGEGVNDAQRIAAHAATGQALASGGYREVVSRLSDDHAAVFRIVALRSDASGREHELFEVRIPGESEPAPARAAPEAASVFDAGPHLIVSGYERGVVQRALEDLAGKGAKIISPITRVGDKWMASCEHPGVRMSECKVEKLGLTTVVTGPTRQAVERKVEELVELGARLQGESEQDGDAWTAVCDSPGAGG